MNMEYVLRNVETGELCPLNDAQVYVGRGEGMGVVLSGNAVSRHHATLSFENDTWYVTDEGSTNGTMINRIMIMPGRKLPLREGDCICFGDQSFALEPKPEEPAPLPVETVEQPEFDEQSVQILRNAIGAFVASAYRDGGAYACIVDKLSDAPLYAARAGEEGALLTMRLQDGKIIVPLFTTPEAAVKSGVQVERFTPQALMPMLAQQGVGAVIDLYDECRFMVSYTLVTDTVLPAVQTKHPPMPEPEPIPEPEPEPDPLIAGKYLPGEVRNATSLVKTALGENVQTQEPVLLELCDKADERCSQEFQAFFIAGRSAMAQLKHPVLTQVLEIMETEQGICVVREPMDGTTLQDKIAAEGTQSLTEAVRWAKQLCFAVQYLHGRGLIYGNLKPSNLLLLPGCGHIKLAGLEEVVGRGEGRVAVYGEGVRFAAPEAFDGAVDARTDVYGIGMNLYYMVTARDELGAELPEALAGIIAKCVAQDPDQRYSDVLELLFDLDMLAI